MIGISMQLQRMYMHRTMATQKQPRKTLRGDARALVESCAGWNSRLAARRITQFLDRELSATGLTVAQLGLMAEIAVIEDDTLGALARRTGLEQSTLSRNLRTLEGAGLIEIAMVESDQRRRAVWLTETGARRLEAAVPIWRKAHARLGKVLSPDLARRLAVQAEGLAKRKQPLSRTAGEGGTYCKAMGA
jgi:DNA-binding MarR family transcriptional regulator